jgi:hypothetical protein
LGYLVHTRIPELMFRKLIVIAITVIGIIILLTK